MNAATNHREIGRENLAMLRKPVLFRFFEQTTNGWYLLQPPGEV